MDEESMKGAGRRPASWNRVPRSSFDAQWQLRSTRLANEAVSKVGCRKPACVRLFVILVRCQPDKV